MRVVWKYDVPIIGVPHAVMMPTGADIIHAAIGPTTPYDHVSVWAVVETDAPQVGRVLRVYGTGHPVDDGAVWVATAVDPVRPLVWHVFEDQT